LEWNYLDKLEISAEKHKNTTTIFDIIKMPHQITSVTMEVTSTWFKKRRKQREYGDI